jgi:hypothetical protein
MFLVFLCIIKIYFVMDFLTVYRSIAVQSIPNTTWTTIIYDVIDLDTTFSGSFSYDRTTGNTTVKSDGYFEIDSQVCWAASAASIKAIRILKNLDANFPLFISANTSIVGTVFTQNFHHETKLSAGDIITVQCYQNTGGPINALNILDPSGLGTPARVTSLNIKKLSN